MFITSGEAMWFFPFVLPICLHVMFTDMARMRITNHAVFALVAVFLVVGLFALPLQTYLWRILAICIVLAIGLTLNYARAMGAGDAKFLAAAAPYLAPADHRNLMFIFSAVLLAAFSTHRLAKYTPLRKLAPDWQSWSRGKKFPMGMALGFTLVLYLGLGILYGA